MAKTTDRQVVNGQTYMIMDSKAREDIIDLQDDLNQDFLSLQNDLNQDFLSLQKGLNQTLLQPLVAESITSKVGYYDYAGFHSMSGVESAEYVCTPGEKIILTCSGNTSYSAFYIYDENGAKIAEDERDKVRVNYEIIVPNNGTKIGLNLLGGTYGRVNSLAVKKASADNPYYLNGAMLQPHLEEDITSKQGYYSWDGFHAASGFDAAEYRCMPGDNVLLTCSGNDTFAGYYIYDSNGTRIAAGELDKKFIDYEIVVPDNGETIGLNKLGGTEGRVESLSAKKASTDNPYIIDEIIEKIEELENTEQGSKYWVGKSILWLGTSIPEGGAIIDGKWNTYPGLIADELGTTMYNRAKGSSMMRAGDHSRVTQEDPFGWTGRHYSLPAYSLSMTIDEKQDFIDNYDYWKTQITGAPESLTDSEKATILSCSYENRLLPYLSNGEHPVDLFVFDHGYNDAFNNPGAAKEDLQDMLAEPEDPTDRTYFLGALRYLINIILEDNPKARIVFIGHYESDRYTAVYKAQEKAHEIWGYPLFRTWEYMGFSQNEINGETLTHVWCPDDIHPHSGGAETLIHYANIVYPFIRDTRK